MSSQPPSQFQVEDNESDNERTNKSSANQLSKKCRLCRFDRKKFICKNCLSNGNFIKCSNVNDSERFLDKQQKLKNLKNAQKTLEDKFTSKFDNFIRLENLRTSILKCRSKNASLNALIKEKKSNIQRLQDVKKENHEKNRAQRIILPKYEDKVNKLGEYVLEAVDKNDSMRKKRQEQMEQLKAARRSHIDKLVKFIFPMSQQMAKSTSIHGLQSRKASNESLQPETISEIAEAMLVSSNLRSWTMDSLNDPTREFFIVAPSLPSNGNYQDYSDWIQSNKDGTVNSGMASAANSEPGHVASNNAYRIAAALTYIAQLVQALSFYLDVRLPQKVGYNDFCTMGLNEQQFRKKVVRLNLNIVYLCYTQNLAMRSVQPARTMENIFQLLDIRNADFGRTGPVLDTSQRSVDSIMQSFTDILDDEHSDTDDDSDDTMLQKDWENVGNLPLLEITQSAMVPQQTASMAGTIMNVANSLSFWKWK